MKQRIITIALVVASFAVFSCEKLEKKLLRVDVLGTNTIEGFMKEYDGYLTTGEGLHAEIRSFWPTYVKYAEIAGDLLNITSNAEEGDRLLFNYQLEQQHVATYPRTYWNAGWSIVTQVTYILEYGAKNLDTDWTDIQKANVKRIMAQAHFARALAMFDLCCAYAQPYNYTDTHDHLGLPVLDHIAAFDEEVPRQTIDKNYDQILDDISQAMSLFQEIAPDYPDLAQVDKITDCYHIGYIACEALLARISLYMEEWDKAAEYAASVMEKVALSPRGEYVDMYRSSRAVSGTESIFRISCLAVSSTLSNFFDPSKSNCFEPAPVMYTLYPSDDIRKDLLVYVPEQGETGIMPGSTPNAVCKYLWRKTITDKNLQVHDPFVFRVSEMYLIHAEAILNGKNDTAAAAADLKALIARARGVSETQISLPSTKAELLESVKTERVKELCFEGHRLFDVTRRKENLVRSNNSDVKLVTYPNYRFVLPINQMEMQSNEQMIQNEGYGKQ